MGKSTTECPMCQFAGYDREWLGHRTGIKSEEGVIGYSPGRKIWCIWCKGSNRLLSIGPRHGPETWLICETCNMEEHICHGCGDYLSHAQATTGWMDHMREAHPEDLEDMGLVPQELTP